MARDFDNTNDNLLATDLFSSLTNATSYTVAMWIYARSNAQDWLLGFGSNATTRRSELQVTNLSGGTAQLSWFSIFSTANGNWTTTNRDVTLSARQHVAVTFDGSSTANDPVMYVNGASKAVTEALTPSGTMTVSDVDTVRVGESFGSANDYDGQIQHCIFTTAILTAADINRAMWWGRPMGGLVGDCPFVTTKLANDGSQAVSFTASGTTGAGMTAVAPVVRPGSAMLGLGVGW